jgi:VRR-NUC domain
VGIRWGVDIVIGWRGCRDRQRRTEGRYRKAASIERAAIMPPLPPREPPKLSEGDIRRDIEIALNRQGIVRVFLNAQYSGPARGGYTRAGLGTGTADLIGYVLGSGRFFALEVKTGSGRVSTEQEAWIAQTNREGGYAAIARTPEEACEHAWKASKG